MFKDCIFRVETNVYLSYYSRTVQYYVLENLKLLNYTKKIPQKRRASSEITCNRVSIAYFSVPGGGSGKLSCGAIND